MRVPHSSIQPRLHRGEQFVFLLLFVCFGIKTAWLAVNIGRGVFPDESTWFGISRLFSANLLPPSDSAASYHLGLITHIPDLYFWLMGRLLHLNVFPLTDLIFLRLVNVALGLTAIFFAWRLITLLVDSSAVRLLFMVMMTSTMMLTFIYGAVNYDNLSTLLAVTSLYYLSRFFREHGYNDLIGWAVLTLAGTMTKNVFLPYAAAMVIILAAREWKTLFAVIAGGLRAHSWLNWLKLLALLTLLALNLNLYLGNLLRFGQLLPTMNMVLPLNACLQNRLFTRGYVVREFKNGRLDWLAAQRLALGIRNPADRADALNMLLEARRAGNAQPSAPMSRLSYSRSWLRYMFARTYGVAAQLSMYKKPGLIRLYYAFFILAAALFCWRWRPGVPPGLGPPLFITLFYITILMQMVNYGIYSQTGMVGLAITGRYIFPVLAPLYIILAHGLLYRMPRWWQWTAGGAAALLFIYGDFPWFLQHLTPLWLG
ncbi:MAG TPA: hypothetical protein ENK33_11590 [Desulfobacterales bacterium]|nr:hypothetical protein [Desulfobacterales bacterium]